MVFFNEWMVFNLICQIYQIFNLCFVSFCVLFKKTFLTMCSLRGSLILRSTSLFWHLYLNLYSIYKGFWCVMWSRWQDSFLFFFHMDGHFFSSSIYWKIMSYSSLMFSDIFFLVSFLCSIDIFVYSCTYTDCLDYHR